MAATRKTIPAELTDRQSIRHLPAMNFYMSSTVAALITADWPVRAPVGSL